MSSSGCGCMPEEPYQEQDGAALVVQQGPWQAQHGHTKQLLQCNAPAGAPPGSERRRLTDVQVQGMTWCKALGACRVVVRDR